MKKLIVIFLTSLLFANDYVVIISNSNKIEEVKKDELKNIFLKKRNFVGEVKVYPVNLPADNLVRKRFEKSILNMDREDISEYWMEKHYYGITPPFIQNSEVALIKFIKNFDGAIGYISKEKIDKELKVIYEF